MVCAVSALDKEVQRVDGREARDLELELRAGRHVRVGQRELLRRLDVRHVLEAERGSVDEDLQHARLIGAERAGQREPS